MTGEAPSGSVPLPRENALLLGQERAEGTLLAAQRSGRLPHAWLLAGRRGIGKATLAYRFARFLLAGDEANDGPGLFGDVLADTAEGLALSEEDPVFRMVAAGTHPDLKVLERSRDPKRGRLRTAILVDEVRPVVHFLHQTADRGGWRIVIVDGAEDMNLNAANGVLKVLEEPPQRTLLLLVSHAPGRLLPTLHSRCCRLGLAALDEELVESLLARYAPDVAEADRRILAHLAEGSIGRALELAESGGLALYRDLLKLLDGLPRLDVAALHGFADKAARAQDPAAFRTVSGLLTWWLARMVRGAAEGRVPPELTAGETALMERLLRRRNLAQWLALWENLDRLFARTESANLDRKQVLITAFLEIESLAA